jgi:5'-nucleotidase
MRIVTAIFLSALLASCGDQNDQTGTNDEILILSIVGTNDVHGELLPEAFHGGLTTFSGYVAALRSARAADSGAVLLIDAGDMWQGTLESNLTEGAAVVEVYNALGYTAATIGNHEFDFGPLGELAIPVSASDDPRGALRQRISEANFPILNANIVDTTTGELIDWENVTPSIITEVSGIKVGIIGLITESALETTIAANVVGLEIAPLADAVIREATALREKGADLVIVTAHAGGRCTEFDDPLDLSSCNLNAEIVRVANALPPGLVDHIIGGHGHEGMAHVINGIAVTTGHSNTHAFDRVDFTINKSTGEVLDRRIFPPQLNCPAFIVATGECAWLSTDEKAVRPATYEGHPVVPLTAVLEIAERAEARAAMTKSERLGVVIETPFDLKGNPESTLGNLFTDAVLDGVDAEIAMHNVSGGIRAILPAGELTFGKVFDVMPFENRVVIIDVSGAELREVISAQFIQQFRRVGFSGMRVYISCDDEETDIEMILNNGDVISDDDRIRIAANDFLATGGDGILSPVIPEGGFDYPYDGRLTRDLLTQWFKKQGSSMSASDFDSSGNRRWNFSESCAQ